MAFSADLSMEGGEGLARLTQQVGQSVTIRTEVKV